MPAQSTEGGFGGKYRCRHGALCCSCDGWCCRHAAHGPLLQTACTRGLCLCAAPSLWSEPDAAFPTALTANSCPVWLWVQAMTLQ